MKQKDIEKTAFSTANGKYDLTRLPRILPPQNLKEIFYYRKCIKDFTNQTKGLYAQAMAKNKKG